MPTDAFRRALGAFATGVTIVTTVDADGGFVGLTANSFNSVSLDPPMVLWSLARNSRALGAFESASAFAIHVLAADQQALSVRFATRGVDKFAGLTIEHGVDGVPLLEGCSARFQCLTVYRYEGGDHVIFVGEVVKFDHSSRAPLVFQHGRYAVATRKVSPGIASTAPEGNATFDRDFLIYLLGQAHYRQLRLIQGHLNRHGLNELDWFVLTSLSAHGELSIAQLESELRFTDSELTYDQVAGLMVAGFVELRGGHDPDARATLMPKGRQAVVELVAAAKAVEADSERDLGHDETRILKRWLRSIIDAPG
jgi:3-hydroxy-9,10-secoandrosta-1,3,5(10)-triene-9,17-dione monooxygenase reductase component